MNDAACSTLWSARHPKFRAGLARRDAMRFMLPRAALGRPCRSPRPAFGREHRLRGGETRSAAPGWRGQTPDSAAAHTRALTLDPTLPGRRPPPTLLRSAARPGTETGRRRRTAPLPGGRRGPTAFGACTVAQARPNALVHDRDASVPRGGALARSKRLARLARGSQRVSACATRSGMLAAQGANNQSRGRGRFYSTSDSHSLAELTRPT